MTLNKRNKFFFKEKALFSDRLESSRSVLLPTDILKNHSQQTDRKELMNAHKQKTWISDSWKRVKERKRTEKEYTLVFFEEILIFNVKAKNLNYLNSL